MEKTQEELDRERQEAEARAAAGAADEAADQTDEADQGAEGADDEAVEGEPLLADDAEPEPQPSRRDRRLEELRQQARSAQERADRIERDLAQERADRQRSQAQRTEAEERDALALMTPEERMDYRLRKSEERTAAMVAQANFHAQDAADKASFNSMAAGNKAVARHAEEVETRLQALRTQGGNIPREQMLRWVLGDKQLAQAGKVRQQAEDQGKRRIAAQTTRPGSGKGDQAGGRQRQQPTAEERLADVTF